MEKERTLKKYLFENKNIKNCRFGIYPVVYFSLYVLLPGAQSNSTVEAPNRRRSPIDAGIERSKDFPGL